MVCDRLMKRIMEPSGIDRSKESISVSQATHEATYGLSSDPLLPFSCVFAALIHDADHRGISNTELKGTPIADVYQDKSVAEQNSVDLAWNLLMSREYRPLVTLICPSEIELARLRQLVVNAVMATDIMDPDLKKLRNDRWDRAFAEDNLSVVTTATKSTNNINRKATIVIEHLIQASDVSHTMQHWRVYTKWNARLFKEMYKANLDGRAGAKDPSQFWAKGEIGFFDFYIIPLAKKLKDCGVFGVSSDEFLNYAQANRDEWERKGESIVQQLIQDVHAEYGAPQQYSS